MLGTNGVGVDVYIIWDSNMIWWRGDRWFVYLLGVILISVVLPSFIIYFSLSRLVVAVIYEDRNLLRL